MGDKVKLNQLIQLIESKSEIAWRDSLFTLARDLGFDAVLFGIAASRHAQLESAFVHSNYPDTWRGQYCTLKLYSIDPTVRHCMGSALPIIWSPKIYKTPVEREFYERASSFGLAAGISFPLHSPSGEAGLISFSTLDFHGKEFDSHLRHNMADLALLRDYALQSSRNYFRGESWIRRHCNTTGGESLLNGANPR